MELSKSVASIIAHVGGKENIVNVWHCMTRLRFELVDYDKADMEAIKAIPDVIGVQFAKGQVQIVIGTTVEKFYTEAMKQLGLDAAKEADKAPADEPSGEKKGLVSQFMDLMSGIFGPVVPAIAGAGMIKGLMTGLVALNVISNTTDTYLIIDMLASGVFNFLPFLVAASEAKKLKTNQYLAIALATVIMYPTMVNAAAAGEISNFYLFGMIPVPVFNYSSSVIPIFFGVLLMSYVHRWVDRIIPSAAKTVIVPTLTLFISGILTLTVVGPIGIYLGRGLASVVNTVYDISPVLCGVFFGAIRPVSILVGMHHAMTPIAMENFASQGWDMLMPMMFVANLSIVGAAAGCYFKANSKSEKTVIGGAVLSGFLGITEPALFGVLTKYKMAFVAATVGSVVGSAFISFFGVRLYGYITSSVFSIPAYIGPYFPFAVLGWIITLAVSFSLSYLLVVKMNRS